MQMVALADSVEYHLEDSFFYVVFSSEEGTVLISTVRTFPFSERSDRNLTLSSPMQIARYISCCRKEVKLMSIGRVNRLIRDSLGAHL